MPYCFSAKMPTMPIKSFGSTGLGMWNWKPALNTLARSSGATRPVSAAAGVPPPCAVRQRADGRDEPEAILTRHREVADQDIGALLLEDIVGIAR
jgi:hypothetical protein